MIDTRNFRYIKVNDKYVITFIVHGFPEEIKFMEFLSFFPNDIQITISQIVLKQNIQDVLKNINSSITHNEEEFNLAKKGNITKDLINKVKEDAKKIRYEIQINNQEIYKVYTYIKVTSKNLDNLYMIAEAIKTKMITKMLKTSTLNFRHILGYLGSNPFCYSAKKYLSNYFVNMTTNNLKTLFPFYTDSVMEKDGVLFGSIKNENKLCVIDMFEPNHLNSNMCIFGSSGGGKSYFTKLLILRNYLKNIKQYVIDEEGEYLSLPAATLNVNKDYINILQIFESDIKDNFFNIKVDSVLDKILDICNLDKYREYIRMAIVEAYIKKGITEDIESIYLDDSQMYISKKIKDKKEFPIIDDVINEIKNIKSLKKSEIKIIAEKMNTAFKGDFKFLNGITNIDLKKDIIVFDISESSLKDKGKICEYIFEFIKEDIKNNSKSLIYVDEIWKMIINNVKMQNVILELYKTVRKKKAGIISITQDFSDFFSINNGAFGRSIFNNSYIKLFFRMDYNDFNVFKNIGITSDEDYEKMIQLVKGEMFMYFNNASLTLKVEANKCEKSIIEKGEIYDNSSSK